MPVQFLKTFYFRYRNQVIPPGKPSATLNTSLLMSTGSIAKTRGKIIVAPKPNECRLLYSLPAHKYFLYRTAQIVINKRRKYPTKKFKGLNMSIEKRLLLLTQVGSNKMLTGISRSHTKTFDRHSHFPDGRYRIKPIHLRLFATLRIGNEVYFPSL